MTHVSTPLESSAPYAPVAVAGGLAFVAGQAAVDADGTVVAPNDPYEQTLFTLDLIKDILGQVGASLGDVASATIFITDVAHLAGFNQAWKVIFASHKPARATVVCGLLVPGLVVEIQAVAAVPAGIDGAEEEVAA